nr:uncharacterized protein LOC116434013 isoform X2 [Nomia melanderi]
MISLDYEENQLYNLYLTKSVGKTIELKVLKNLLSTNYELLQQQKTILNEEREKLDNINFTVWETEDKFCNEVWNFSLEHNFNVIFKQHPDIKDVVESHNCKYSITPYKYIENIKTYKEYNVVELSNEIDNIKNQMTLICNKNIEQDITNAMCILNNLKSFSEDILNLIRLINPLDNSQNICNTFAYERSNVDKGFISAKKCLKIHPVTLIEKNITKASNAKIGNIKKV